MADKSAEKQAEAIVETATEKPVEKKKADVKPEKRQPRTGGVKKYPLDSLASNSRKLFGISSCTFAGATAGLSGSYSISEIKDIIEKWCNRKGV